MSRSIYQTWVGSVIAFDRPKNFIFIAYGKNRDRYAVRARVGCRSDGQRRLPANGPTIGHIVDLRYVPLEEVVDWLKRSRKKNAYSLADLQKARSVFGTVVLECDLDTDAQAIYKAYSKRWEIELVMRFLYELS